MGLLTGKTDPTVLPTAASGSAVWIEWYKSLENNFGKKIANQKWLEAWSLRGSTSVSDNTLREFMKKKGIEIPATWGQKIGDAGVGVVDEALGIFHLGKTTALIVGGVILVPIAILLVNLAVRPKQIGTIAKAAGV